MPRTRLRLAHRAGVAVLLAVVASSGTMARADAATDSSPQGRIKVSASAAAERATRAVDKPERTDREPGRSRTIANVKLVEGAAVVLHEGRLRAPDGSAIAELDAIVAAHPQMTIARLFAGTATELDALQREQEAATGRRLADLDLWFTITAPSNELLDIVDAFNALDAVEIAEPAPVAVAPTTPDFTNRQGYRSPATSGGIDSNYANGITGGKGEYVRIIDLEYGWNRNHEDLSKLRAAGSELQYGTPCDPFAATGEGVNHGTAVIGQIAADPNGFGVTGMSPGAWIGTINSARRYDNGVCSTDHAGAILSAASRMSPGDVLLIEQQIPGPNYTDGANQFGLVPVEYDRAAYDAIVYAVSAGIVVVEAAGNGTQNLDGAEFAGVFTNARPNSGAILVGAGGAPGCTAPTRGRLSWSNHGSRVDVHAWGECIATTGYGNLQAGDQNQWYTGRFGGTSGASPMVTSAAAIISSISEARGRTMTPAEIRTLLRTTGQAQQFGLAGNIGPIPDLRAAITAMGVTGTSTAPTVSNPVHELMQNITVGDTLPIRVRWTATDADGIAATSLFVRVNGGKWIQQTLPSATSTSKTLRITPGATHEFAVRAQDTAGNWSTWKYGTVFRGDQYEESAYTTYAPAGTWTRATWAPASGGAVNLASARGATASFTFTGTSVAWVGTKATNRGQASIYLDGVFQRTIDLYSASTLAQQAIVSYVWPTSGRHTIQVVVEGTSGRPKVDIDTFVRLR